jgi:hypothetical protein
LIFQLIGTLGAVDPYLVKQIKRQTDVLELPPSFQLDENDAGMKNKKDEKKIKGRNQQYAIVSATT